MVFGACGDFGFMSFRFFGVWVYATGAYVDYRELLWVPVGL